MIASTVTRRGCGTYLAALLHQAHGEQLCPRCGWAFYDRTGRPAPPPGPFKPVTEIEAARNRQVLELALADYRSTPGNADERAWRRRALEQLAREFPDRFLEIVDELRARDQKPTTAGTLFEICEEAS